MSLYDTDVVGWAEHNAKALLERRFDDVDWDNVAEEILSVGKSEANGLRSQLFQVLVHMLKARYQLGKHGRSWDMLIVERRDRAQIRLRDNPSLKPRLDDILLDAYRLARVRASKQTGIDLSVFPVECPYTSSEVPGQ